MILVATRFADHGHVVERRQGTQRTYPGISSGRTGIHSTRTDRPRSRSPKAR